MNNHHFTKSRRPFPLYGLLLSLCVFLSCGQDNSFEQFSHELYEKSSVQIRLDSLTSIDATSVVPSYLNDTLHLFITNELNNSIDVYNVETGNLARRFTFEREGPDGIPQIRTCIFRNKDSIYVIGKFHIINSKMINWEGEVINSRPFYFKWNDRKYNVVNHISTVIMNNGCLYISIGPLFDLNNPKNYNREYSFELKYDIKNQTLDELPIHVPPSYIGKAQNFYSIVPYRTLSDDDKLVYSWPNEENIEIRPLSNMDSVAREFAHIKRFGKLLKGTHGNLSSEEKLAEALDHVLYTQILYDPYREVYYRIASIPSGRYKRLDLNHWTAFGRNRLGIIVLDKDFNIIACTILESEMYNCFRSFVGKKGLYISKNNIFRKDFDENILEYAIFEPGAI